MTSPAEDTRLSENEIIEQARADLGETIGPRSLLQALEAFYFHGFSDEQCGDVDYLDGHCYRVHRWLVWTDSRGFHDVDTFDTEAEASTAFGAYAVLCSLTDEE